MKTPLHFLYHSKCWNWSVINLTTSSIVIYKLPILIQRNMIKILFMPCQETDPVAVSRGAAPLALVATPTALVAAPWSLATPALVVAATTITSTTIAATALTLRTRNNHQSGTQTCLPQNYAFQHHCPDFITTKSGRYAYGLFHLLQQKSEALLLMVFFLGTFRNISFCWRWCAISRFRHAVLLTRKNIEHKQIYLLALRMWPSLKKRLRSLHIFHARSETMQEQNCVFSTYICPSGTAEALV